MQMSSQLHASAALTPGEIEAGTHCTENWVGPKAGPHVVAKRFLFLPIIEP
jgi:hypothetical protein